MGSRESAGARSMSLPRFYVREHMRDVRVVDRDYCHRDVEVFPSVFGEGHPSLSLARRRAAAAELCAALNLESAREPVSC